MEPELEVAAERARAADRENVHDLRRREAEFAKLGEAGSKDSPHAGEQEPWVGGHGGGDVGVGDAEAREEGQRRLRLGGRLDVGEQSGGLEGLCSGKAAVGDEVIVDGEGSGGDGCDGGGQEAVEGNVVAGGEMGWRTEEGGKDASSEVVDHGDQQRRRRRVLG